MMNLNLTFNVYSIITLLTKINNLLFYINRLIDRLISSKLLLDNIKRKIK